MAEREGAAGPGLELVAHELVAHELVAEATARRMSLKRRIPTLRGACRFSDTNRAAA